MRALLISACAVLFGAAFCHPALAADAPLLRVFKTVCADHAFDQSATEAAARADGFGEAASETARKMKASIKGDSLVLERRFGSDLIILSLTGGQDPARPAEGIPLSDISICSLSLTRADATGAAAIRQWVGVPKSEDLGEVAIYGYRQGVAGRSPAPDTDPAAVKKALDAGEHRILILMDGPNGVAAILQAGRTAKP